VAVVIDLLGWKCVHQESLISVQTSFLYAPIIQELQIMLHLWHYSLFWALDFLRRCLFTSLSSACLFHPHIPRICDVSLQVMSSHLVLGFSTGLVLLSFRSRTFFRILSSSILIICPTHLSLLILISSTIFRSLYKL